MDPGPALLLFVLTLVSSIVVFERWMRWRATVMGGTPAPSLPGELGDAVRQDALVYFYSPSCGPCRRMTPLIEQLARTDARVRSIDVTRDLQVARAFGVLATPTVVTIRDGIIVENRIGAQPAKALRALLQSLSGATVGASHGPG